MKTLKLLRIFILIGFWSSTSFAGFGAQVTGFFLSDSSTQSASGSQSKYIYTGELLYSFDKYKFAYFGFQAIGISQTDVSSSTTTIYSAQDYGPMFSFEIDKSHHWVVAGAYNISASATYDATDASTKTWAGSSYWLRFGYQRDIGKDFYVGAHVVYFNANYNTEQAATTQSVSYARSSILPVFSISYWH